MDFSLPFVPFQCFHSRRLTKKLHFFHFALSKRRNKKLIWHPVFHLQSSEHLQIISASFFWKVTHDKQKNFSLQFLTEPEVGAIFPMHSKVTSGSMIEELPHFTSQSTKPENIIQIRVFQAKPSN